MSDEKEVPCLSTVDLSEKENKPKIFSESYTRAELEEAFSHRTATLAQMAEQVKAERAAVKKLESALMLTILADLKGDPPDEVPDEVPDEAASA